MLEPNNSEVPSDGNAEEACKSDYFSDDGEIKPEPVLSPESSSRGKRKNEETDDDETKKIKVSSTGNGVSFRDIDSTSKIVENSEFIRASSVTSDNSDEFVDASDVPPDTVQDKNERKNTDTVDSCVVQSNSEVFGSSQVEKSVSRPLRLPTFVEDPLERFKSSALRRGLTKESGIELPQKSDDLNMDDKDKCENKNSENKPIKKVKLNRSRFFSAEKPKFSDESSSDSNSKFNTSTSPIKNDVSTQEKSRNDSAENKISQKIYTENANKKKENPSVPDVNIEPEVPVSVKQKCIPAEVISVNQKPVQSEILISEPQVIETDEILELPKVLIKDEKQEKETGNEFTPNFPSSSEQDAEKIFIPDSSTPKNQIPKEFHNDPVAEPPVVPLLEEIKKESIPDDFKPESNVVRLAVEQVAESSHSCASEITQNCENLSNNVFSSKPPIESIQEIDEKRFTIKKEVLEEPIIVQNFQHVPQLVEPTPEITPEPVSSTNNEESTEVDTSNQAVNPIDSTLKDSKSLEIPRPKEPSKLELALMGRSIKKLEIQLPPLNEDLLHTASDENCNKSQSTVETNENEETKGKIKLHLSLQGDKVSIKKGPLETSTGEVRVKRKYTKRNKEALNLKKIGDKTYKLRNRTIKKDGKIPTDSEPSQLSSQNSGEIEIVNIKSKDSNIEIKSIENIDIPVSMNVNPIISSSTLDSENEDSRKTATPGKVQPIKLKISKNANVTIECGSSYSSNIEESVDKPTTTHLEDNRKKDQQFSNYMEQAANAWSGPDLQRVERLLKESNITITPVMNKEPATQLPTTSILKPMLTAVKDKSVNVPKFSTPSTSSVGLSLQSSTASITPIIGNKHSEILSEDEMSESSNITSSEHKSSSEIDDHIDRFPRSTNGYDLTPVVDVKSEIRKKLASAERRKQEFSKESTDSESESSDIKSKASKSLPDLLPISLPTPEILQSLSSSITGCSGEAESKVKSDLNAALLPLLQTLPKRRGRPTKAMVAARNALKQSQEAALENLKQFAKEKNEEGVDIMAHFPIPLFDITDPEDLFKTRKGRKSKVAVDKSDGDQSGMEDHVLDPIREMEELKRLEEERQKKEEEKERRNELRRQKAKERSDLVKAKRLKQKMRAEERQKQIQEKRRLLQEEKKKLEEEIKNLPSLHGFDDETRMSTENSQLQTTSYSIGIAEEDSSGAPTEIGQRVKKSRMEVNDLDSKDLTVDQIAEYQWPIQGGELYMIQEQVSNFLGVKSFKRKYPDIKRRPVDSEERAYLVDSGLVSESLCDLGLTAVCSAEVLDIMCADFPEKYEELRKYMREKQMKELSFKQKAWANGLGYKLLMADGTKQDLKKRAMESASNWNSALNKSRSEDRRCAMDLQTFIVHYPKSKTQKMSIPTPKVGSYPVSILPGQFCDFYKKYNSTELRYMPINTVMYGPLKNHSMATLAYANQTDSDDSSSSDESSTTSEGTQATEDTIEDTDKDMSVDESSQQHDKSLEMNGLKNMSIDLNDSKDEIIEDVTKILCKICLGTVNRNKENQPEVLICCSQCTSTSHPTCLDLSLDMVTHIKKYAWQCPDCKICARCKENADEDKMLFCDACDRGYHIYCVGLKKVPSGRWQCQECTVESNHCVTPGLRDVFKEPSLVDLQDG